MSFLTTTVGATAGFLSQDPFDNPFSSLVGAAIGGFAGSNFVYQKTNRPIFSISDKINYNKNYISGEYNNKYFTKTAQQRFNKLYNMPKGIQRLKNKLNKNLSDSKRARVEAVLAARERRYGSLMANLQTLSTGRNLSLNLNDYSSISMMLKSNNKDVVNLINDTFKIGNGQFGSGVFANQMKSGISYRANITESMDKNIALDVIKKHFMNIGNSEAIAERKAANIQFALEGKSFILDNTSLLINDNGKNYDIPLTGHTNGNTRFTKVNDTFYVSKPFNPFMRMAINGNAINNDDLKNLFNGTVDPKDLLKTAFDPEEMLAFKKIAGQDVLGGTNQFVRESIEYLQSEAHLGVADIRDLKNMTNNDFSQYAQRVSAQSIGFLQSFIQRKDGTLGLKEIDTMGDVSGGTVGMSEYSHSYSYLKSVFAYDPLGGQPVNTIGRYTIPGLNNTFGAEESLFPTAERGYGSQIVRSYIDSNNYTLRRLDIDSDIAEWISKNISDSYSIDDGSGLITYRDSKQLTGSHYLNFEIPRSANGSFLAHSEIIDALIDPAKKQNILNHISINKDTVLGFDKHGTAIRLNNVYSNATIESADVVNNELRLRLKASFNANNESWVKLFGASSKAGYTRVSQHAQRMIIAKVAEKQLSNNADLLKLVAQDTGIDESHILPTLRSMSSATDVVDLNIINNTDEIFKRLNLNNIDIITGVSEAGNKSLPGIIRGTETEALESASAILKQVSNAKIKRGETDPIFQKHIGILGDTTSSRLDLAKSAMFMLAQTDSKGSADILTTLRSLNPSNSSLEKLSQAGAEIFYSDITEAYRLLDDAINNSVTSVSSLNAISTNVAIDLGVGLHGIGNVGSMSWIEKTQLKANGITDAMIDEISRVNNDALYEIDLIKSSTLDGVKLDDEVKSSRGRDIISLFNIEPQNRTTMLQSIYGNFQDYASHNLSLPEKYSGIIKSIPISTISTNRTNMYDIGVADVLSDLEKSRRSIISLDLEYAAANAKQKAILSDRYIAALGDYEQKIISLSKGEGNIIKEASKRSMHGSGIFRARSVGGSFAEYMSKTNQAGMIMSMDTIRDLAERSGVKVDFQSINGQSFQKVVIAGTDKEFTTLVTREPAQGALSALFANLYLGDDLDYYDVGIANTQKNMFKSGMFLDFDYDILKIASANFKDADSNLKVKQIMERQEKYFAEFEGLINTLSRKGNKADPQMHASFGSFSEYLEHSMYSAIKSKQRKILAPLATDIAMNMTDSLQRHLSTLNLSEEEFTRKSILGRTFIHNMTEALIKSAHRSSKDLANTGAVSEIEMIKAAYDKVLNGDRSSFDLDFKNAASHLFGVDNMDDSVKGLYNEAIGDITEGTKRQAAMIAAEGGRIQDFRGVQNMQSMMSQLNSFQQREGIPSSEAKVNLRRAANGIGVLAENIKRNIYSNRKPLGFGLGGLAATAMFVGSEKPEMTKEVLPYKTSDGILPVPQSENAHIYKKKEFGQTTNIKARHYEKGSKPSQIRRDAFGNHNQRTNITIRDKREDSY